MGRPREFNPDKAMQGAMDIFWRQGYKATNLPDLLKAMGLTRGSFYKAFKDKESVYLGALDHYDRNVIDRAVQMLGSCKTDTASDCLAQLFASAKDQRRGCFLCNAIVELAPDNPQVAEKATYMTDRLRTAIKDVLARYDAEADAARARGTADLILHLYFGHQALGKSGGKQNDWKLHLQGLLKG